MTTTTGADLLTRAEGLTRELQASEVPVSRAQWETFDVTLHRLLHELVRPDLDPAIPRDPTRAALTAALYAYPEPLRPVDHRPHTPQQAAQQLGHTTRWVHAQIRRGNLSAVHEGHDTYIRATALEQHSDITPADPADPHPLARVATTFGALADLLHHPVEHPLSQDPGQSAGAAVHVLAIGAVAARHTLTYGPIADANRPLAVAQYAERVIDNLQAPAQLPRSLDRIAAVTPAPAPATLNERLEGAVYDWVVAGRAETQWLIPSADVLRAFANQGTHLYAVTLQLLQAVEAQSESCPREDVAAPLVKAASALREADTAWAGLTTAARPTHEFVTASRALFTTLNDVTIAVEAAPSPLDRNQALGDLTRAADRLNELLATTQHLPERLMQSELLFTPATQAQPTPERLPSRAKQRLVVAETADAHDLIWQWHRAAQASDEATRTMALEVDVPLLPLHRPLVAAERANIEL